MQFLKRMILPISLILLILLGFLIWIKFPKLEDFGLNFTTEIIGVFITVFIVDFLIKKREEERIIPIKIIAYQETSLLFNRFLSLIFDLYSKTIQEDPPIDTIEFLKSDSLLKALYYADCNADAATYPEQKLPIYIANCGANLSDRAEKILDKYSIYLDPKITNLIHKCFVENVFLSTLKITPSTIVSRKDLPYPQSLSFHVFHLNDKDTSNLIELFKLLDIERQKFLKIENGLRGLSTPEYIVNDKNRKLIYRISEEKLGEQIRIFNDWKKTTSVNKYE